MPGSSAALPPWYRRAVITALFGIGIALGAFYLMQRLSTLLVMLLVAVFISFALEPGVQYLSNRGWKRGWATAAVFAVAAVAFTVFVAAMIPLFSTQISRLVDSVPGYVDQVNVWLVRFDIEINGAGIAEAAEDFGAFIERYGANIGGSVLGIGAAIGNLVFQTVTILLFAFYLVADGPKLRHLVLSMFPPRRQAEISSIWEIAIAKTGGYVYSRVLLAGIAAAFTWLALTILDIPNALALGLWVGVLSQFVPVVGTYIAAILPTLVALFESPWKALIVLLVLVGYQQIENYAIAPKITARTMEIHPAVAVAAVIAGASLLGPIGAVLALPAAAIIAAFISTTIERHEVIERGGPVPSGTEQDPIEVIRSSGEPATE